MKDNFRVYLENAHLAFLTTYILVLVVLQSHRINNFFLTIILSTLRVSKTVAWHDRTQGLTVLGLIFKGPKGKLMILEFQWHQRCHLIDTGRVFQRFWFTHRHFLNFLTYGFLIYRTFKYNNRLFHRASGYRQTNTQTVPLLINICSVTDRQNFFCKT